MNPTALADASTAAVEWLPHLLTICAMIAAIAIAWGVLTTKVTVLRSEVERMGKDVDVIPVIQTELKTAQGEIAKLRDGHDDVTKEVASVRHLTGQFERLERRLDWFSGALSNIAGKIGAQLPPLPGKDKD